jgi:hypothetical protein
MDPHSHNSLAQGAAKEKTITCHFANLKLTRRFSQPERLEPVTLAKQIPRKLGSPWNF